MRGGEGAGVKGAVGKRLLVAVRAAAAAVQRVTGVLTRFVPSAAQFAAADVCLCGAVVLGAVVLGVPAVPVVELAGLEPGDLLRVSQTFK